MASVPKVHQCNSEGIQELCRQVAEGLQAVPNCPCCSAALQVKVVRQSVEVSCPTGCFRFECSRDPHTGDFVTGLLDFPDATCPIAAPSSAPPPA